MINYTDPRFFIYKQNFIKFIETNSNCFDRENKLGHLTGSALVINFGY